MLLYHKKYNEYLSQITKNTTKNRLGATENAPSLFYTLSKYPQLLKILRQYVLTKPLPFSKPAYIYAEI